MPVEDPATSNARWGTIVIVLVVIVIGVVVWFVVNSSNNQSPAAVINTTTPATPAPSTQRSSRLLPPPGTPGPAGRSRSARAGRRTGGTGRPRPGRRAGASGAPAGALRERPRPMPLPVAGERAADLPAVATQAVGQVNRTPNRLGGLVDCPVLSRSGYTRTNLGYDAVLNKLQPTIPLHPAPGLPRRRRHPPIGQFTLKSSPGRR